jgi:hypothetical protein
MAGHLGHRDAASLLDMEFKVYRTHEGTEFYRGEATYKIENGVLTVRDGERFIAYSPSGWERLETTIPPSSPPLVG